MWNVAIGAYVNYLRAAGLAPVAIPPGVPRPVPDAMLRDALALARPRERLMIRFAAFAGLRAGEIAKVRGADYDGGVLYVEGKGGRVRFIPIQDSALRVALRRESGYLFPGPRGHLTAGTVTRLVSEALPEGWTCHKLRHRFASRAYAGTRDILGVQRLLGHSSPATTQRYVATGLADLVDAVKAAA